MEAIALGNRIAAAREEADMSVLDVSRLVAVAPDTYKKWENGTKQPRANKLVMLSGVLNVVPAWLLEGDDDFLQNLDRDQKIVQLNQRISQLRSMQNRMITMLDELTCELDDVSSSE